MKALYLLSTVLFLLPWSACAALEGQVFVVTKGRDNVKIGALTISAYRASEFNNALESEAARIAPRIDALEKLIARCDREIKVAQITFLSTSQWENKRISAQNEVSSKYNGVWIALADVRPIAGAVTDADGRFKMNVPTDGSVILYARANRRVGDHTENYIWVKLLAESAVILSNEQDFGEDWATRVCERAYANFVTQQVEATKQAAKKKELRPEPKPAENGKIRIGDKDY